MPTGRHSRYHRIVQGADKEGLVSHFRNRTDFQIVMCVVVQVVAPLLRQYGWSYALDKDACLQDPCDHHPDDAAHRQLLWNSHPHLAPREVASSFVPSSRNAANPSLLILLATDLFMA
jgi:hypothetical protein